MQYHSTRDKSISVSSAEAIKTGLSAEGGLFVPESFPSVSLDEIKNLASKSYNERAYFVLSKFLSDFTEEELKKCIDSAYTKEKFETESIAPVYKLNDTTYFLELWHGPTCAFKDMALQILPHLLTTSMKKTNEDKEIVILVATSGDTGKAALAGFADVKGTKIIVFYPKDGVSPIQEKQMVTQKGDNTYVVAIKGNFDDAQTGVKNIFGNKELARELDDAGYQFSSANSINIGRLVPQIVYYVYAYVKLLANEEISEGEMLWFLREISEIFLQHFMQRIWDFLLESLYVLQMRIRYCMISFQQVCMTGTENLSLQALRRWIFLSQATLRDLYTGLQAVLLRLTVAL